MKIRFNVVGFTERRTSALLECGRLIEQAQLDQAIEERYRQAVRRNWKERARVLGVPRAWLSPERTETPGMLRRQAD